MLGVGKGGRRLGEGREKGPRDVRLRAPQPVDELRVESRHVADGDDGDRAAEHLGRERIQALAERVEEAGAALAVELRQPPQRGELRRRRRRGEVRPRDVRPARVDEPGESLGGQIRVDSRRLQHVAVELLNGLLVRRDAVGGGEQLALERGLGEQRVVADQVLDRRRRPDLGERPRRRDLLLQASRLEDAVEVRDRELVAERSGALDSLQAHGPVRRIELPDEEGEYLLVVVALEKRDDRLSPRRVRSRTHGFSSRKRSCAPLQCQPDDGVRPPAPGSRAAAVRRARRPRHPRGPQKPRAPCFDRRRPVCYPPRRETVYGACRCGGCGRPS